LEPNGYTVLPAKDEREAIEFSRKEVVHLAVIDIRLVNDQDQEDWSGLHLADRLDPSISKIILTGHRFDDATALVRRVLGPDDRGQVMAADFVLKREGPEKLLEAIRSAFQNRIRLNTNLLITMSKRLTWRTLVEQLNLVRDRSEDEKLKAEEVIESLTCSLFFEANAVHFLRTTPGYGSSTVALVRPAFEGAWGTELAVKFGPRESIAQEVANYKQWVNPFAGIRSTQLQEGPVWSREMGAIAYKFVGENMKLVADFGAYYTARETSDTDVLATLENLFKRSCEKWYQSTRPPTEPERKRLDLWYREQLNLLNAAAVDKLHRAFNSLLERNNSKHGEFRILEDGLLSVRLNERGPLTLPNPIHFAFDDKSGDRLGDLFPTPSKVAITHGDLHASNVLVGKSGETWLIDFHRTGWGPALRDFAEMESNIKFDLLEDGSLRARYDLERVLLFPRTLNEPLSPVSNLSPKHLRALAAIQRLREMAWSLTDTESTHEYYVGLLFLALKRISGSTSSSGGERDNTVAKYHALLSAAMICQILGQWEQLPPWQVSNTTLGRQFFKRADFDTTNEGSDLIVSKRASPEWRTYGDMFVKCVEDKKATKDDVLYMEGKLQESSSEGGIGFLVHSGGLAKGAPRQIWQARKKRSVIIPLYVPRMRQAMERGDSEECYRQLVDLKRTWGIMTDPYEWLDATSDPQWFVGRGNLIEQIVAHIESKGTRPVLVYGMRRSGKTALLNQVELRCQEKGFPTARWIARKGVGYEIILYNFIADLVTHAGRMYPDAKLPPQAEVKDYQENPTRAFRQDLQQLSKAIRGHRGDHARLVLLIDEMDISNFFPWQRDPDEDYERYCFLFQTLKEVIESPGQSSLSLVFAAEHFWIDEIDRFPHNSRFQNPMYSRFLRRPLAFLSSDDTAEMVTLLGELVGLEFSVDSLERIYSETCGHPQVIRWLGSCIWRLREGRGDKDGVSSDRESRRDEDRVTSKTVDSAIDLCLYGPDGESYRNHFEQVFWWNALSPNVREDQQVLAELATRPEYPVEELYREEVLRKSRLTRASIESATDRSVELGVIERSQHTGQQAYHLTIPLYWRWIRSEKLGIIEPTVEMSDAGS